LIDALQDRLVQSGAAVPKRRNGDDVEYAVKLMIALARAMRASDIHITSHTTSTPKAAEGHLRLRIDGVLYDLCAIDRRLMPALVECWKRLAGCDVHETQRPQDGRIIFEPDDADMPTPASGLDVRVCFLPAGLGEEVTARLLDATSVRIDLDRMDYAPGDRARIDAALQLPWGMMIVCGPAGSGKTTSLYGCLNRLARPELKLATIEDPIEFYLPWVSQVPVRHAVGVDFAAALRSIMRSDPDVIMVGEIRDGKTAVVAHQAALTGHFVLTTLHTADAAAALRRMVEIGVDPFVVADAVKLVLAQRLVRKLCPHCAETCEPGANELARAEQISREGGIDWDVLPDEFKGAIGCDKCGQTGYRGRTVIAETLKVTPRIAAALRDGADVDTLHALAVEEGMTTLGADAMRRAALGETSLDEALRVAG
jgi:type II secretory ATPase GspE/PulE/Tfp pilus assembly ATPase PilB-like protein